MRHGRFTISAAGMLALVAATTGLLGCTRVVNVRGPDGETAYLLKCAATEKCLENAAEICPEGYVIRTSGSVVSGYVYNGMGGVASSSELLVSCKGDLLQSATMPNAGATDPALRECAAAFKYAEGFAAYWAPRKPGWKTDDKPPERHDFVSGCASMPPNVRACLNDSYRLQHITDCHAELSRLDHQARGKIDDAVFGPPPPPEAAQGPSGY